MRGGGRDERGVEGGDGRGVDERDRWDGRGVEGEVGLGVEGGDGRGDLAEIDGRGVKSMGRDRWR